MELTGVMTGEETQTGSPRVGAKTRQTGSMGDRQPAFMKNLLL